MTLLFLFITLGLLWINLVGLGLLGSPWTRDYAVARFGGPFLLCLAFFFLEHFVGLGAKLAFLPFSTAISLWAIARERNLLRRNLGVEMAFAAGFLYCLAWRYWFPDIALVGERFPDLVFIHDYYAGARLPAADRWLPPFKIDTYYSFQYYAAALMGRWFRFEPGLCFQYAYCVLAGLIAGSIYGAARRLCPWRPGRWVLPAALLLGGSGLGLVVHLSVNHLIQPTEICRYLGLVRPPGDLTAFGRLLSAAMYPPGRSPPELPVETLSFLIQNGEFHPPLIGFAILTFSLLLMAVLEGEENPRERKVLHALLGATIPLCLIGNTWVFPLQTVLVVSWLVYRTVAGERTPWLASALGAGAATFLAYPFLVPFMQGAAGLGTALRFTRPEDRATLVGWLSVFWPVVGLIVFAAWNRERRGLTAFFIAVWIVLMAGTEIFYNHDINGGTWERFNSTLKWWAWVYSGAVLTLGAVNLASQSRICRYGSLLVILGPCAQAYDYARHFIDTPKPSASRLDGSYWLTQTDFLRSMVEALKVRPDGICIDSDVELSNTEATTLALFANKQSWVGWPIQEGIWRDQATEIRDRMAQIDAFYHARIDNPLAWLLANHIRYVFWLQRDNDDSNRRFLPLWNQIRSRYIWRRFYGNDRDWAIGFWERIDAP